MKTIIHYFSRKPIVGNVIMFGLILAAVAFWAKIGKEQMPDLTMNWMRVTVTYPGASAEDVELSITKPIEEKLKGVTALDEVSSTSSSGVSTFGITFEADTTNLSEKIQEVKDAIDSVEFPREAEDPVYRQFKSSERAIIDIALYYKDVELLDVSSRIKLQEMALAFKNKLLSLDEISGVEVNGYLRPELQIKVDPEQLLRYEVSMQQVIDQIQQQNVRTPIGSMSNKNETEITLISELDDIKPIKEVIVRSGFEGQKIRLKDVATVERGFEKSNSIVKVQGHEGIIYNVQKSTSVDILSAQAALTKFIKEFKKNNPDTPIDIILMDDESYEVRNRLSLISSNGIVGFILIILILFLFLDLKAGIWVAMGIPFSLAFTLIMSMLMGFTINNMTLAAIIIVLGIVVDDAIIVAENITRRREDNLPAEDLAVERTASVIVPIIASILTTCVAFVPLYFFTGRFGLFVKSIPTIVFLMLFASFIESTFILPGHMIHPLPGEKFIRKRFRGVGGRNLRQKLVVKAENLYERVLLVLLPWRSLIVIVFLFILALAGYIFQNKLKYVMFPREEAQSFSVKVIGPDGINRNTMARLVGKVESLFLEKHMGIVTSVRTNVGQSRRGGEVRENEASLRVELLPPSEREIGLNDAIAEWQQITKGFKEFQQIRFLKDRFGSDSGSAVVIEVQENNNEVRTKVLSKLHERLKSLPYLQSVEVEVPVTKEEYRLYVLEEEVSRMNIGFDQLSSILRTYVQGQILYTLNSGEEEVDVRLSGKDDDKTNISEIMKLRVANKDSYLVPISGLVKVEAGEKPSSIQRVNFRRTVKIFADNVSSSNYTPLEIAEELEEKVFPEVLKGNVSTDLRFRGEIEDSRESQSDFIFSVTLVILLIYILLVFLFNSLWTPLLIAAILPFGVSGAILTLMLHGMEQYGFFAVVGTLGLLGIVINDSIVLVSRLEEDLSTEDKSHLYTQVAKITSTRLRAVIVTTLTTVMGLLPTAYGWGGYDSMLAEMMIVMAWGLVFATFITLLLVPCLYSYFAQIKIFLNRRETV